LSGVGATWVEEGQVKAKRFNDGGFNYRVIIIYVDVAPADDRGSDQAPLVRSGSASRCMRCVVFRARRFRMIERS